MTPTSPNRTAGAAITRATGGALLVATLGTLAVGAIGPGSLRAWVEREGPGCAFAAVTGVPCALCGMTHATTALGAGDLDAAFAAHPLAPLVVLGVIVILALTALGRSDALLVGRRPWWILGAVALVWAANLTV